MANSSEPIATVELASGDDIFTVEIGPAYGWIDPSTRAVASIRILHPDDPDGVTVDGHLSEEGAAAAIQALQQALDGNR